MSITLGALALPDGLRWSDEFAWEAQAQSTDYGLTGALLIQIATKQAGRPITLLGGSQWAWMRRADLIALRTLIDQATVPLTLTLHDGRTFQVLPDRAQTALDAEALPIVGDSGPADPQAQSWYVINSIKLIAVS